MENAKPVSPVQQVSGRVSGFFRQHHEKGAFYLLILWCLLPAAAAVDFCISAALGRFPAPEALASMDFVKGEINYAAAVKAYQNFFFFLGAFTVLFALFCVVFCRKQIFSTKALRQKPWFYLLALLLLWAVISSLASDYFYHAFLGGNYVCDGLASYFIYASVFLCASLIRRENYRKKLMHVFTSVICSLALVMLIQEAFDIPFLNYCFPSERAVVFNQFNHFGYMLCMSAVCLAGLFLHDRQEKSIRRYLYLAGVFFLLYALIVNDTLGAILAALLSMPLLLALYIRSGKKLHMRAAAIVLLLILLAGLCFFAASSEKGNLIGNFTQLGKDLIKIVTGAEDAGNAGTGRFELWQDTLDRISERPVFGFGPEGFVGNDAITDEKRPHNEYLQIAGYLGIPALLIYLAAILTLVHHWWKHGRKLAPMVLVAVGTAVSYLISALVGNPVFNTAPYFWMFLGLSASDADAGTPLLLPEKADSGRDFLTVLYTLLAVMFCLLFCLGARLSLNAERNRELEDLRTMQGADAAVQEFIDPSTLHDGEIAYYWYDKKTGFLFPTFISAPEPYGLGSGNAGGAAAVFFKETGLVYDYDENADYAGSVLVVAVRTHPEAGLQSSLRWFAPET